MLGVVGVIWIRRRWVVRREQARLAEWATAEARAAAEEQAIIDDLEARYLQ